MKAAAESHKLNGFEEENCKFHRLYGHNILYVLRMTFCSLKIIVDLATSKTVH